MGWDVRLVVVYFFRDEWFEFVVSGFLLFNSELEISVIGVGVLFKNG